MACSAGQVDLNHASISLLETLPTPDGERLSAPVAENIIDSRPYLRPSDLRAPAVTGVTDNHVALWLQRGLVCATPILVQASDGTYAPETPDICSDASQVDLNDKLSYNKFADLFGKPTADRLVDGMPYSSVTNAVRRAGVGPGQLNKLDGRLCLTPYPIRFDGTDWAFATPASGVAVSTGGKYGNYTLTVPSGVTTGNGSWASIQEVAGTVAEAASVRAFHLATPSVDAHIHGSWNGTVGVTLPPDPTDVGDGYVDTAIHYSQLSGPMLYANGAISTGADGRLTVAETDLSITSSLKLAQRWVQGITNAANSFATQAEKVLRAALNLGGNASCSPDLTGQSLPGGAQFDVAGQMLDNGINYTPRLNHCLTQTQPAAKPEAQLVDNRGAVLPITDYSTSRLTNVSNRGGGLWTLIASGWNTFYALPHGAPVLLGPGDSFSAQPTAYYGQLHVVTNAAPVAALSLAYQALDEASAFLPPQLEQILQGSDCTQEFVRPLLEAATGPADSTDTVFGELSNGLGCFHDYVNSITLEQGGMELVQRFLPNPTVGDAEKAGVLLERLKRAFLALKVAKWAAVAADVFDVALADGTVTMTWKPAPPADPAVDSKGRQIIDRCVTKTFSYDTGWVIHVDEVCQALAYDDYSNVGTTPPPSGPPQDAFDDWNGKIDSNRLYNVLERDASGTLYLVLLENERLIAHPINKSDESAFKQDWPEHEWVSEEFPTLIDEIGAPAVNDPLHIRNFTEGRGGNWLLREANGTAWYIDADGVRHWVSSVSGQEELSRTVLTLDPAQWAHDICPYRQEGATGLQVC